MSNLFGDDEPSTLAGQEFPDSDQPLTLPNTEEDQSDPEAGPGAGAAPNPTGNFQKNDLPGSFLFLRVAPKGDQRSGEKGTFLALAYDPLFNVADLDTPQGLNSIKARYQTQPPYIEDLTPRSDADTVAQYSGSTPGGIYGRKQSFAGSRGWFGGYKTVGGEAVAQNLVWLSFSFSDTWVRCRGRNKGDVVGSLYTSDPNSGISMSNTSTNTRKIKKAPNQALLKPNEGSQRWYEYTVEFYSIPG